jgi:serralysin
MSVSVLSVSNTIPNPLLDASAAHPNQAPRNTDMPKSVIAQMDTDTPIDFLAMFDPDAGAGEMQTTLSVRHGWLTFANTSSGATITGNGTDTVTLTGTMTQINFAFGGLDFINITYHSAPSFFGVDTLTMTTNDNGNTGMGGPLSDTDQVSIIVKPSITGSSDDDSYVAAHGFQSIDAGGGVDSISFDFRLADATVRHLGDKVLIDGGSSGQTLLRGFEKFVFTDGTVNNNDGDALVDDLFYYAQNLDVWNAHQDADAHYHAVGWHEAGRDPNAFFSTSLYLALNPDVKAAGVDPLIHWHTVGWEQGRLPSFAFDAAKYLQANPDVAAVHVDPLWHFLSVGASEGREPVAATRFTAANGFDYIYYLQHNSDVAAAGIDPLQHFETVGWKEGRNPNALFDVNGYLAAYTDVAAAGINPFDHYNMFGWHEGRDPSVDFDTTAYLAANPDVGAAHINPLLHFLKAGMDEGRSAQADGIWG